MSITITIVVDRPVRLRAGMRAGSWQARGEICGSMGRVRRTAVRETAVDAAHAVMVRLEEHFPGRRPGR